MAHFVIPRNVKHGDSLTCSYAPCRALGVKFCFCVHCNIPVAKRCFRMRHHHSEDDAEDAAPAAPGSATIANNLTHNQPSDRNDSSTSQTSSSSQAFKVPSPAGVPADISDSGLRSHVSALTASPPASSKPGKKREHPSSFLDHDHGSADYHHVAKVPNRSDSSTDCAASSALVMQDRNDKCIGNHFSSDRRVRWASLLSQRPTAVDRSTGKVVDMDAWLLSVIQVSNREDGGAPRSAAATATPTAEDTMTSSSEERSSSSSDSTKNNNTPSDYSAYDSANSSSYAEEDERSIRQ
jgi:hypothetical protein